MTGSNDQINQRSLAQTVPTITERFDQRLGTTRLPDVSPPTPGSWQGMLERFRVPDVPRDSATARAWLTCESPHTEEVTDDPIEQPYPLRGQSGKYVTRALIECGHLEEQHGRCDPQGGYVPVGELVRASVREGLQWLFPGAAERGGTTGPIRARRPENDRHHATGFRGRHGAEPGRAAPRSRPCRRPPGGGFPLPRSERTTTRPR